MRKASRTQQRTQENPCVFVWILSSALNCQYCTQGYSKNNPSNVHPLLKWDNFWGWWDMEKARSFRRWKMKYMNLDGLWGSPVDIENGKKVLKKKTSLEESLGFSSPVFYNISPLDKNLLFCKNSYGILTCCMYIALFQALREKSKVE